MTPTYEHVAAVLDARIAKATELGTKVLSEAPPITDSSFREARPF